VSVKASPALTGQTCGSPFTETYTVTFHIAANGPGGQIAFTYTTNNGQSSAGSDTVTVDPGATKATYTFTWSGKLPADHTAPGIGLVMVTAPNPVTSTGGVPSGQCTAS
jgi:hypothetical protein